MENVIQWADEQKQRDEERKAKERFRRTCRYWPIISMATVAFGGLAFFAFDPVRGIVCTIVVFIGSVIVVEHFS